MSLVQKIATAVLAAGAGLFGLPASSDAGIIIGSLYKPDLIVASVQPSPLGPYYARVVTANVGKWTAGTCQLRVYVGGSKPTTSYTWISIPHPPNSTVTQDVYVGKSMSSPGTLTIASMDINNHVIESNESNNTRYWVAPPY
jgi:subtilase family serine protease